jgi:uncharacterized membrane protein YgdD (TMEM256/DUF423 family)
MELQSNKSYTLIRVAVLISALLLACYVALDAMGAHAFKEVLANDEAMYRLFTTGTRYLLFVAFGTFFLILLHQLIPFSLRLPLLFAALGTLLFPFLLLCMFFIKLKGGSVGILGAIAPIGGTALIMKWLAVFWSVLRSNKR